METERTEDLGVSEILPISVGGERVELRVLTIDEGDAWLRVLTEASDVTLEPTDDAIETVTRALTASVDAALPVVKAYDLDGKLPDIGALRRRMTRQEVRAALDAMATAEDPFAEGARRLVATAFGAPSTGVARRVALAAIALSAPSPSGLSPTGDSTGPGSGDTGAERRSSSSTSTDGSAKSARKLSATRSRTE